MPTLPNPVRQAPQRHPSPSAVMPLIEGNARSAVTGEAWLDAGAPSRIPLDARVALLLAALKPLPVSRDAVRALAELAREHHLEAGQTLFCKGEPAAALWLLVSGLMALGQADQGKLQQQTRLIEPGQWLDASTPLIDALHQEDAVAKSASLVWRFEKASFLRCMQEHPTLAQGLLGVLALQIHDLTAGTLGLMQKDAEARCATWLLQHAEVRADSHGHTFATVEMRERKRHIASQLAITPETFSRMLRHLSDRGLIEVMGYTIRVLDLARLRTVAKA